MDIVDKVVVVTGAGSGIGRALAQQFAVEGARFVVCADLDGAAAQETASAIGPNSHAVALDVASRDAINELVMSLEEKLLYLLSYKFFTLNTFIHRGTSKTTPVFF